MKMKNNNNPQKNATSCVNGEIPTPVDLKELREKIEKDVLEKVKEYFGDVHGYRGNELKVTELSGSDLNLEIDDRLKKAIEETINQVEEIIKEWILNLEKHFVLTYLKGTDERIIQFNPSVKVWEKEFKQKLLKLFEEKLK